MSRPTLTVSINAVVPHLAHDHTEIAGLAADFEAWGADQLVLGEHLLMGPAVPHPGASDVDLMIAWPEPFLALTAAAARTSHVALTTGGVLGAARSAVVVAKLAATLDAISGGRFRLGLVPGWYEPEFDAIGVPFEERFERTDELIAVCRALWGSQPASFSGRWTSFTDLVLSPPPLRGADLPIWFGGRGTPATARRVARCDGWIVSEAASLDEIQAGMDLIRDACRSQGLPSDEIGVRATLPRTLRDGVRTVDLPVEVVCDEAWEALLVRTELGVTDICIPLHSYVADRDAAAVVLADIVARLDHQPPTARERAAASPGDGRA